MTETPRPDPWAQVRTFDVSTYGDCRMERDYYGDITSEQTHQRGEYAWVDEVDAARAADAARHQQEIAAKDAELDKLRVFLGDASPKSDALRRQFDAEIATLRATVDQQAETIHQLQATLPELHDAIERQSAQIAALTDGTAMQHARKQADADGFQRGWHAAVTRVAEGDSYRDLAGLVPIIDERVRDRLEAADARCATLTAALEQKTKWADFLGDYLDGNHESHGSDRAWDEFIEKEHETPPVTGCECAQCRAALAAAPQGGTPDVEV